MIETRDLTKHYGPLVAVDRLSFQVEPGESNLESWGASPSCFVVALCELLNRCLTFGWIVFGLCGLCLLCVVFPQQKIRDVACISANFGYLSPNVRRISLDFLGFPFISFDFLHRNFP